MKKFGDFQKSIVQTVVQFMYIAKRVVHEVQRLLVAI